MNARNVQHPYVTEDHPLAALLWMLFCGSIWLFGIALCVLIIVKLYFS